jgi:hypothetical protein
MEGNKGRYHFVLTPKVDGSPPQAFASDDLEALKKQAFEAMTRAREGWCYFIIDGVRCNVSMPRQSFVLQLPEGKFTEIVDPSAPVFQDDGSFLTLVSA